MNNKQELILDTQSGMKYKIVGSEGQQIAIKATKHLAELYVNGLPEELREGCNIVPITEDNKQILFG